MSQPPPTPRQKKVQEALDLFAQLQSVPFVVVDDEQRVRHAANLHREASSASAPSVSGASGMGPANMLKKGSGTGGGAAPSLATTKQLHQQISDLQRKLAVSDGLMKKLHRKNRELLSEIEDLKSSGGGPTDPSQALNGGAVGPGASSPQPSAFPKGTPTTVAAANATGGGLTNEQLKSIIIKRDQEILALRKQLAATQQQQKGNVGGGGGGGGAASPAPAENATVLAASPSPSTNQGNNTPRVGGATSLATNATPRAGSRLGGGGGSRTITIPTNVPIEAHVAFLHKKIDSLQKDYQQLLDSRLEAISQGESTGKVNKQVKVFFAAVKAKIASDMADYEAERALWHQRVAFVMNNNPAVGVAGSD